MQFVLTNKTVDTALVEVCCEYIMGPAKALKTELTACFITIQQQLVSTFTVNPKNFKCLETLTVLIGLLSHSNAQMGQEISGSIEALCQLILPKTMKAHLKPGVEDTFANRVDVDVVT